MSCFFLSSIYTFLKLGRKKSFIMIVPVRHRIQNIFFLSFIFQQTTSLAVTVAVSLAVTEF